MFIDAEKTSTNEEATTTEEKEPIQTVEEDDEELEDPEEEEPSDVEEVQDQDPAETEESDEGTWSGMALMQQRHITIIGHHRHPHRHHLFVSIKQNFLQSFWS